MFGAYQCTLALAEPQLAMFIAPAFPLAVQISPRDPIQRPTLARIIINYREVNTRALGSPSLPPWILHYAKKHIAVANPTKSLLGQTDLVARATTRIQSRLGLFGVATVNFCCWGNRKISLPKFLCPFNRARIWFNHTVFLVWKGLSCLSKKLPSFEELIIFQNARLSISCEIRKKKTTRRDCSGNAGRGKNLIKLALGGQTNSSCRRYLFNVN